MTYSSTQHFEFTALIGADILAPGDNELGRGDVFQMPASAIAKIVIAGSNTSAAAYVHRNQSDARSRAMAKPSGRHQAA